MTAVGDSDSSLATKCLELCQTLAGQGLAFNFSLTINSTFSFSLDTRDKGLALATTGKTKKKSSPSTLRRNARRKEAFLQRKQNPAPVSCDVDVDPAAELPQQGGDTFKCDICGNAFKSENGLRIHKGKSHKGSELPQCEKIRYPDIVSVLHQDEGGIGKSIPAAQFPETQEISRVRSPREISRAEGMDFPIPPEFWWSTDILLIINPIPLGREGLTVLKSILPCR